MSTNALTKETQTIVTELQAALAAVGTLYGRAPLIAVLDLAIRRLSELDLEVQRHRRASMAD